MRGFFYLVTAMGVIALATWAYQENYRTQRAVATMETVQQEIAQTRARLNILRAEWAYLNRPDRLRDLADINFDQLGLLPLRGIHFGRVDQVGFPEEDALLSIENPIEVSSVGADQ